MTQPITDTLTPIRDADWQAVPGLPGIYVMNLYDTLDETARTGRRTRLVKFDAGAESDRQLSHEYHEEVYLISGDMYGFREAAGFGSFDVQAYVHRAPGTLHAPIGSKTGCVMLEIHYF
ncbi:cupin domain-containing protein [Pseudogemmobacter sonorensis]|uniref:cupin domain-containing protein n=1 Tax=Pseudogemmobacter sonorensis TaxID=2989681 RepID=UPI00369BDA41